jgi:prevent-host-death family protein
MSLAELIDDDEQNGATQWIQEAYNGSTMKRIGIRELKQRTSAVIRMVAAGEQVEVTDYGHPVARIVPLKAGQLEQLVAEGRASEPRSSLLDLVDELGLPLPADGGEPLSVVVARLRADER